MKKNVLSLMLLSMMVVSLFSCSKDEEDFDVQVGIIGEWTLESAETTFGGKTLQEYVEETGANEEEREYLEEINLSGFELAARLNFQEQGLLVIQESGSDTNGSWSAEKQTLTVTEGDHTVEYKVKSLSDTKAVLSYEDPTGVYGNFTIKTMLTLTK
ncbi:hypothetical protein OKW21_005301 [Catalinimonas alkaloidigena]|uniref:hypothetical protein n=1 Tax=Catalinimonas alkaloidigena TaxID=1075417 RepID=UPI0024073569|nr:hypothetical protein [Catalinimonas alkaloidigena]MDF9800038.1 hypothetical protein [Catalinimonas alkaloidigena]